MSATWTRLVRRRCYGAIQRLKLVDTRGGRFAAQPPASGLPAASVWATRVSLVDFCSSRARSGLLTSLASFVARRSVASGRIVGHIYILAFGVSGLVATVNFTLRGNRRTD